MIVYGDLKSGNCLKVKWVCDKIALPYTWVEVDTMKGGSRTEAFLRLNPWGQVPTVTFEDGRALAQSNAIIRYLARGSSLIPSDPFAAAQMDAWLFWEQNSHEPYVAVCRFQAVYLGKPVSELDPNLVKRGYTALDRLEDRLIGATCLVGQSVSLADIALLAYTRVAHEGGFDLGGYPSIRRWIRDVEQFLGLSPVIPGAAGGAS